MFLLIIIIIFLIYPLSAKAVLPPDFVFNVGTQIFQFFSIILFFFSTLFAAGLKFFRSSYSGLKHKTLFKISALILIISASLIASLFYIKKLQKSEYQKWLENSVIYSLQKSSAQSINSCVSYAEMLKLEMGDQEATDEFYGNCQSENSPIPWLDMGIIMKQCVNDKIDLLMIGQNKKGEIKIPLEKFSSKIKPLDDSARFIIDFYQSIADGDFRLAYEKSEKNIDFETFRQSYSLISAIAVEKLIRIDNTHTSLELTVLDGGVYKKYGVLLSLMMSGGEPTKIEKTAVKLLVSGIVSGRELIIDEEEIMQTYQLYHDNRNSCLYTTTEEFKDIIEKGADDYLVLDARENIELELESFQPSIHMRFADLTAGRWLELPADKKVYVICSSGLRGKSAAEFLRTKKILASYLENGAVTWKTAGGRFISEKSSISRYEEMKFRVAYDMKEFKNRLKQGIFLVDSRESWKFDDWHIAKSISIPTLMTTSYDLEEKFKQVPPQSKIITLCDSYVNCFDAKITGRELKARGHEFIGRYHTLWIYEKENR